MPKVADESFEIAQAQGSFSEFRLCWPGKYSDCVIKDLASCVTHSSCKARKTYPNKASISITT